ncbi:cyclin-dependent kinases regulatory subunit [Musca domestica]|uniref:Cyclin-dependent kinases regulatory subunit n=1 Tax=Musca domestica TaxID=7370 RepID=A0A1I8N8F9_MUSDO|nr:cyclin-dependent kinases regulatory subunit [Musca domestica]XP_058978751.1 cyclin-dependent kinases regulatory subunit [Musca domestica]XP_058978752.1 cyclin-dependent kinases regulatory subunit [Musca domestica]
MSADQIQYSEKYFDAVYEYRHVILPAELTKLVPKSHLMTETEWRNLGVQQSPGWVHYMMHAPEPHVILFRRPRTDLPDPASTTSAAASGTSNNPDASKITNNVSVQG